MSSVVVIFKDDRFIVEQPIISNEQQFVLEYLESNNIENSNIEARSYPRLKYLEFLQESRQKDREFKIKTTSIVLLEKKLVDTEIDYEINWLNESDLNQYYSPSEIEMIEENKEYFNQFGCLSKVDFSKIPNEIPLKTRKAIVKEIKYDVLEEFTGTRIEI